MITTCIILIGLATVTSIAFDLYRENPMQIQAESFQPITEIHCKLDRCENKWSI